MTCDNIIKLKIQTHTKFHLTYLIRLSSKFSLQYKSHALIKGLKLHNSVVSKTRI